MDSYVVAPFITAIINLTVSVIILIIALNRYVISPILQLNNELETRNKEIKRLYDQVNENINKTIDIHSRTLPEDLLENDKISIATFYQPADKLGGDFYNYILTGDKMIFYLSDVTGHGMEGAFVSAFVKECVRGYINFNSEADIDPTEIMLYLEREYRKENFPEDYFISCFMGVIDFKTYELSFTGAGFQENMLVSTKDDRFFKLSSKGLPISNAIEPELMEFNSTTINLSSGATLMLNTDGLTEQMVENTDFYNIRNEVFYKCRHMSPSEIVQAIKTNFKNFNHGSLEGDDDITLLVARLK